MSSSTITGFNLSSRQRQIWQQQSNLANVLTTQFHIELSGNLDVEQLRTALQTVVDHHEIFRTAFQETPGLPLPLQVIQASAIVTWQVVDLDTGTADAMAVYRETERLQFSTAGESQVRAVLFKHTEQQCSLLLTLPALCADAGTCGILLAQLRQCYGGLSLDADPVQYIQFANWQEKLLAEDDEDAQTAQAFWQQQALLAYRPLLPPFRYREFKSDAFAPQVYRCELAADVASTVLAMASAPEAVLLSSWLILLWQQTRKTDIAIGIACEGRQDEDLAEACGPLTGTLPLQIQLSDMMAFSALLRQVEITWQDLNDWQDYFSAGQADSSALPVGFEFIAQPEASTAADVRFNLARQWVYGDRLELRLTVVQQGERLSLEFHYDQTVMGTAAIAALATQLSTLISHVSRQPTAAIAELSLGHGQPLNDSTQTNASLSAVCIHQLFEQQAEKTPDRAALVVEEQSLTYQALNLQANQLARHLQQLGAGPDQVVAVYLERSPELLIALLSILKAGSAYLPIDPTTPTGRVSFQLQDAKVPILIAHQPPEGIEVTCQVVCWERDRTLWQQPSDANLTNIADPANLAYVIYTSGSTGQPKGVAVEHRQLFTYINNIIDRLELPETAHYATVSTLAADLGQTMIFPCLSQGGTLHLITPERAWDAQGLINYAQQQSIDCLKIVPSHLHALLQTSNPQQVLPRQRLILGGEACPWSLIEKIHQTAPNCRCFNHYGPTETTVGVLTHAVTVDAVKQQSAATVPLGHPLANAQVYLLSAQLEPVPIGIPGEIYIDGDTVTRGYLGRPSLTAERFMPNPFGQKPGARMYRTGDLARYLPDGTLEFLQRADLQVKLHGFRIELGAIETQLLQHPDISTATVVMREDTPGNPLLVAYLVLKAGTEMDTAGLREFLQQWLPDYMTPSLFVTLSALPLTPNGKVDRQALPLPERISPALAEQYVAPRNPTEEAIAAIWMEILDLEAVGVYSNFFELGGHSLLATQVLSRLRETFQVELPLRQVFEARTVAEIAEVVETALLEEIEAMTEEEAQAMMQ
ncbi:MAG: amino acid adenylation domain-containing protein [Cyanobacteria bacterium P01_H01_bin.21]